MFGGPEEHGLNQEIEQLMKHKPFIVEDLSLKAVAALIQQCGIFVTNDSGLMHVSVAVGTKTIALFGPTDPSRTAPYGADHIVIERNLKCSPCWGKHNLGIGIIPCIYDNNLCMQQITVQEVFDPVAEYLQEKQKNLFDESIHNPKK